MTQAEFLRSLSRQLRGLSRAERDEALRYYREFFLDAELDDGADVTPLVGTPEDAARRILADTLERQEQSRSLKSGWRSVWLVLLGVLAAPVALPLAVVAFALVLVVFAVLLALLVAGAALAIGGVAMLPAVFFAIDAVGQAFVLVGYAFLLMSVGTLLCVGMIVLWRLIIRGAVSLLRGKKGA